MALNEQLKPVATVAGSKLPKMKQTTLGLYVTAAQAYEMWKAAPDKVKIIDVRTPEEFAFVGHPEMAWNVPMAFVTYERKGGKFTYGPKMNKAFVVAGQGDRAAGRHPAGHVPLGRPWRDGGQPARRSRVHQRVQHRRRNRG